MREASFALLVLADGDTREAYEFAEDYCFAYQHSANPYPRPTSEARASGLRIEREGLHWNVGGNWFDSLDSVQGFYAVHMRNPVVEVLR